ncbi:NAD(P)H-dependent oxidoreductase [Streptomyces sp. AK02-01A]|uniref:NADPH-dependent FMN reductase n=1 Tax=Streptomyces sp. AK02-01A TaxID=3028648 RepID=UPI0029A37D3E|nr:NAD(P)H-dependent oxidoreductase [Streptomyces sp. AK02-01A]MDX3853129.1 NAD(P)H-dependent oxidoreductase [Streptomyces sp. AK02-01A]
MTKPHLGVVIGTTRQHRFADKPAHWIFQQAAERGDMTVELIDLRDYVLPFFDEPQPPIFTPAKNPHAARWCAKVAAMDGYIFVTGEYNHSISGALKNALDFPYAEFNKKPASFIAYGNTGGARAVEHLRQIACELELVPLRRAVHIGLNEYRGAVDESTGLGEHEHLAVAGRELLDEISWWATVLKTARDETSPATRPTG